MADHGEPGAVPSPVPARSTTVTDPDAYPAPSTVLGLAAAALRGRGLGQDDAAPAQAHRGMTLIAVISLFIGTRGTWTDAVPDHLATAAGISLVYGGILAAGVLTLTVRTRRALVVVDAVVLAMAVALVVVGWMLFHGATDEAALTAQAADAIDHGRPVYGQAWPWIFHGRAALTKTMDGSADYTFGYPPLAPLLTAPVRAVVHGPTAATIVSTAALLAGTCALWVLLPALWRSAATAVCLGFGLLPGYARDGYPAVVAVALLVPVAVGWTRTGAGGRLGRAGVLRAVCLGAACATQQLAWFLVPFLLAGLYAVRRGELGGRPARAVVARYTGIALLVFALVNAYPAAQAPRAWAGGLLLPLTQKAILHGQGLMGISYYLTDGSSRLSFYSYASVLLLLGLLAATVLFMRRLGPALTVLPWLAFYLATRSQDGYYLMMTPLWLAAAATVPRAALARAWQPRLPRGLRSPRAKAALAGGLLVPALLSTVVAAASPPPLRMTVTPQAAPGHPNGLSGVTVRVRNTSAATLVPHFASRYGQGASAWWDTLSGPRSLRPRTSATYRLRPSGGYRAYPGGQHPRFVLIAVTGTPETISSALIPKPS
ncbi:hypothetical protein [Actinacidiphila yeochonensis]|uniref:hypothetical protein n=1 Tax=Actinacidiphila yeochonensis TaxID=89050 RepID=UPI000AA523B4|nr:hypothetical protein [Actinacidiphila yeochonensis]